MFVCVVVLIYRPSPLTFWLNFCMLCEQSVPPFFVSNRTGSRKSIFNSEQTYEGWPSLLVCVPGSVYACCCSSSVHVCSKCDEERRTRIAFVHDMLPTRLTPSGVELSNIQVRTLKLL